MLKSTGLVQMLRLLHFFSVSVIGLWVICRAQTDVEQPTNHHHRHHHYNRNASILLQEHGSCLSCLENLRHIPLFSENTLEKLLESNRTYNDENSTIVIIRLLNNQTDAEIGAALDLFVAARPWWIVELEPYSWFPWLRDVILHRVPNKIRKHLEAVANQNYRPAADCASTPMLLSGHTHDAWGNR